MPYRFAVALLCASFATVPLLAEGEAKRLQDVKTIFVGSFGDGPGGELIRSKVVSYLVKSKRIDVVESVDSADAILTGAGELSKSEYYSANANSTNANASGGTRYHATAGVRLINKEKKILWADEASNGMFYRSASSSVADKIVKALFKAIDKETKGKP